MSLSQFLLSGVLVRTCQGMELPVIDWETRCCHRNGVSQQPDQIVSERKTSIGLYLGTDRRYPYSRAKRVHLPSRQDSHQLCKLKTAHNLF
jgi:hypothetical protein